MLFKEIVDGRTHARTDDGRRTMGHQISSELHVIVCPDLTITELYVVFFCNLIMATLKKLSLLSTQKMILSSYFFLFLTLKT